MEIYHIIMHSRTSPCSIGEAISNDLCLLIMEPLLSLLLLSCSTQVATESLTLPRTATTTLIPFPISHISLDQNDPRHHYAVMVQLFPPSLMPHHATMVSRRDGVAIIRLSSLSNTLHGPY